MVSSWKIDWSWLLLILVQNLQNLWSLYKVCWHKIRWATSKKYIFFSSVLRIWDVFTGYRIRGFPSRIRGQKDPQSRWILIRIKLMLSSWGIWSGIFIPDPDLDLSPSWIRDPRVQNSKKHNKLRIPDPDPQHSRREILINSDCFLILVQNFRPMVRKNRWSQDKVSVSQDEITFCTGTVPYMYWYAGRASIEERVLPGFYLFRCSLGFKLRQMYFLNFSAVYFKYHLAFVILVAVFLP